MALLALAALSTGALPAAERIDHEANCTYKKLTWDDFRGPVVNGQQIAWIASTVIVDPIRVETTEVEGGGVIARARNPSVYALMNKLESGVRPGRRSDDTLAHEQTHFDITEYFARRLSREVRELTVQGATRGPELERRLVALIEQRYRETLIELERMQKQYDDETYGRRRAAPQNKWTTKAAELLASEKPYELR